MDGASTLPVTTTGGKAGGLSMSIPAVVVATTEVHQDQQGPGLAANLAMGTSLAVLASGKPVGPTMPSSKVLVAAPKADQVQHNAHAGVGSTTTTTLAPEDPEVGTPEKESGGSTVPVKVEGGVRGGGGGKGLVPSSPREEVDLFDK
jgi:hypothetical protein